MRHDPTGPRRVPRIAGYKTHLDPAAASQPRCGNWRSSAGPATRDPTNNPSEHVRLTNPYRDEPRRAALGNRDVETVRCASPYRMSRRPRLCGARLGPHCSAIAGAARVDYVRNYRASRNTELGRTPRACQCSGAREAPPDAPGSCIRRAASWRRLRYVGNATLSGSTGCRLLRGLRWTRRPRK